MEALVGMLLTIAIVFIVLAILLSFGPLGLWMYQALAAGVK